jgi:hypothetical protein
MSPKNNLCMQNHKSGHNNRVDLTGVSRGVTGFGFALARNRIAFQPQSRAPMSCVHVSVMVALLATLLLLLLSGRHAERRECVYHASMQVRPEARRGPLSQGSVDAPEERCFYKNCASPREGEFHEPDTRNPFCAQTLPEIIYNFPQIPLSLLSPFVLRPRSRLLAAFYLTERTRFPPIGKETHGETSPVSLSPFCSPRCSTL